MTDSKSKVAPSTPILVGDLPRAETEALKAFTRIEENTYEFKSLGKLKQAEDALPCDCSFEPGPDLDRCCGESADCINRLTQTECLPDECRSGNYCRNQRFQRRQYAKIEVVQTEKKGFGLRAAADLKAHDFIYEYIGEVVTENTLLRRMRQYGDEGIEHFYFMMLQKNEFIDATKRGDFGRFANHSCNPNCYVAKWYVGRRIRMGIFAKRAILKDEELTFNYNVDRYGHDAQPCYCGEPNCVGFIGGKTQTEVAIMDDLYIEALGLDDEQIEMLSLNMPRKGKKGKKQPPPPKLEDIELELKPIEVHEVSAVVNAIRRAIGANEAMLVRLLSRVEMSDDALVRKQFPRLRGLGLMADILEEYPENEDMQYMVVKSVSSWTFVNRIKIEDTGFEEILLPFCDCSDDEVAKLAQDTMNEWSQLEKGYRIPRRDLQDENVPTITHYTLDEPMERPRKRTRTEDEEDLTAHLPSGGEVGSNPLPRVKRHHLPHPFQTVETIAPTVVVNHQPTSAQLNSIIQEAIMAIKTRNLAKEIEALKQKEASTAARKRSKSSKPKASAEEQKANKEKRLMKLIGEVVVRSTSKYARQMGKENFKKYAKEATMVIAEKEKKSSSFETAKLDKLSEEKQAKIKKFSCDFFVKAIHKIEKKKAAKHSQSATPSNRSSDPRRPHSLDTAVTRTVSTPATPSVISFSGKTPPDRDEGDWNEADTGDVMKSMVGEEDDDGEADMDLEDDEDEKMEDESETLHQTPMSDDEAYATQMNASNVHFEMEGEQLYAIVYSPDGTKVRMKVEGGLDSMEKLTQEVAKSAIVMPL